MGQSASGPIDAQQLVMMQQQQIYRQQQSRTSTLGSTRGGDSGAIYQRMPHAPPTSQDAAGEGMQMDNMKGGYVPNGGGNPANQNAFPTKSPQMMRGPTRAPPPPPANQGFSNNEDYMEPVISSSTSNV